MSAEIDERAADAVSAPLTERLAEALRYALQLAPGDPGILAPSVLRDIEAMRALLAEYDATKEAT